MVSVELVCGVVLRNLALCAVNFFWGSSLRWVVDM